MNQAQLDKVVEAVLYEGYILYPYRPSSTKNRQRFTFGRVYPEAYSLDQDGREPCVMQTQCLVEAPDDAPELDVSIRFLHPLMRDVGRLPEPASGVLENGTPEVELVDALEIDGHRYPRWQEAVEREVAAPRQSLSALAEQSYRQPFAFAESHTSEPLRNHRGEVEGAFIRHQPGVEGQIEVSSDSLSEHLFRITVRILNQTPVPDDQLGDTDGILMRTFASTHTILHAKGGAFVSMMDPPETCRPEAEACENIGTWPVLVGEEGELDTILSSPIVLYDYPELAPESPGDLFDSTEIDELLTLRIMTMTDEEKREMRHSDERAREILQRTESMPEDYLARLHGAVREMQPAAGTDFFGATGFDTRRRLDEVNVEGARLHSGDRVRIHPKARADVMDLVLEGRTAVIEAIEEDFEDRVHLALVLDDDPGHDLGMMRQTGHRFFFGIDEVEPVFEDRE